MGDTKKSLFLTMLFTCLIGTAYPEDIFNKIDDKTVQVISTSETDKQILIDGIIKERSLILARVKDLDESYKANRELLQKEIDAIDKIIKGAINVGVKTDINPENLESTTVFKLDTTDSTGAGSLTGLSDMGIQ